MSDTPTPRTATAVSFHLNGTAVEVSTERADTLLDALRGELGVVSVKDGCSPQGQCGCCTVLVDGDARVACVTPLRRVAGRSITTLEGLDESDRHTWCATLCATGGSQCGFCTPGIVMRLEWLRARGSLGDPAALDRALAAHSCRCTGWQGITEAADAVAQGTPVEIARDWDAASRRAELEGGSPQRVGPDVAAGAGPFADDSAPADALLASVGPDGEWVLAESLADLRRGTAKVQGRNTTVSPEPPIELPDGDWAVALQTCWVEPAYLEPDVAWCAPGGEPVLPLQNGGAFGGKVDSPLPEVARRLANESGRPVVARWSREDVVRFGPKRPPVALGVDRDGTGIIRVPDLPGVADLVAVVAPGLQVETRQVAGLVPSLALRGAVWVEAAVAVAAATGADRIVAPNGSWARAEFRDDALWIEVDAGEVLDEVVLRSYCIGAAHMAAGWVTSEGLAIDDGGQVRDLTIRSFGVLRPADLPPVQVRVQPSDEAARNGSDAVFAAVALAVWRQHDLVPQWPTGGGVVT